jgi:hypothetical protein
MSMPISILWNVRISLRRKFLLGGLFSLVVITMLVAIVRVTVVSRKGALSNRNQVEVTWLYLWHFIESSVGTYLGAALKTSEIGILTYDSTPSGLPRFLSHPLRDKRTSRRSRGKESTRTRRAWIWTKCKDTLGTCKVFAGIALQQREKH